MPGVLLNLGQSHAVAIQFKSTPPQNYYLRLMTNTVNPALSAQVGSGITEVVGTGYAAIVITRGTDWAQIDAKVTAVLKTFVVGVGGWANCNGYFLALTPTGNDAIFAEPLPSNQQGNRAEGDEVRIPVSYELRDINE